MIQGLVRLRRETLTAFDFELPIIGAWRFDIGVVVVTLAALLYSLYEGGYIQTVVGIGCAYLIAALGYNLLLGYAGQMAFGQAGFMAIGAYIYAVLEARGVSELWGFLAALTASALVAAVIGMIVLRTREFYLALVTLAFAQAILVIINLWPATNGENGIAVSLMGQNLFYVAIGLAAASMLIVQRIVRSRIGRAFYMIRSEEQAASVMGVPLARTRTLAFVLSGIFGGMGGIVLAASLTFITPSDFTTDVTLLLLAMIVVGGLSSIWGTVIGVALLTYIPQVLTISPTTQDIAYGAALYLVLVLFPGGVISLGDAVRRVSSHRLIRRLR
jgi:branched-chain amino acid transport system permease protein